VVKTVGGSNEFEVEHKEAEIPEEGIEPEEEVKEGQPAEVVRIVNEALVETVCLVVSKVVTAATHIPELAFDEKETEQLKQLWSPLMPAISPTVMAVLGTAIIIGGKVGMYFTLKKPSKKEVVAEEKPKEEKK